MTQEILTVGGLKLTLEKGTILVPEHRGKPGARTLTLPYQRLVAAIRDPQVPPLFLLNGGPGQSNLSFGILPRDLWGTRDLVLVGYRGVDGETLLPDEAFTKALWNQDAEQSEASLRAIGASFQTFLDDCRAKGIDVEGYTTSEVVGDLEAVRQALGYATIDLYGVSYGTRLAYLYGLDHPETTRKLVLVGANPPGHFAVLPSDYDDVLSMYGVLLGKDFADPVRRATQTMPAWWLWWPVPRGLVKLGAPLLLANPSTAASFLDAYEKAAAGDASGLVGLGLVAPLMTADIHSGDLMLKGLVDFQPGRDYLSETADQGQFGRSFLRAVLGMAQLQNGWNLPRQLGGEPRAIEAPTLVLNGSLDTQTPLRGVKADLMPLLRNGSLVVLEDYGHFNAVTDQGPAVARVIGQFLDSGAVDREAIPRGTVTLKPALDLSLIAWGATAASAVGVAGLVWLLVALAGR